MATLLTDLSIPLPPHTSTDAATPEVMPYAIEGTVAEPSLAREITGWQAGVVPPAIQENWMRQNLWRWLGRASCTGFFTQRSTVAVNLSSITLTAGTVITLHYNGTNNDYIVTSQNVIDGYDATAAAWAQQITETAALRSTLDAQGGAFGVMLVFYRSPGVAFPHAVTASVSAGSVSVTDLFGGSDGPLLVTTAPGGGNGNTLAHAGPTRIGDESAPAITTNANTLANGKFAATGDAVDEHIIALATTSGSSGSQLLPVAGFLGAAKLVNGGSFDFTAKVIACDVATGQIVSTWKVDGTGYVAAGGTPTMQTLSAVSPVTISASTRYVGVDVADWSVSLAPKYSDGGSFTLSVGFAISGGHSYLSLLGDGVIPGYFKATVDVRYITP